MAEIGGTELLLIATFLPAALILIGRRARHSPVWAPMVTPLASIIGSGFLVSVPLLASRLGYWAMPAMAGLCGLAWLIGDALRYNIAHAEPLLAASGRGAIGQVERVSHLVLAAAYFVSVAYYLALLGAFVVKLVGIDMFRLDTLIASAVVVTICGTGILRGLAGVEEVEKFSVGLKVAAIISLLLTLVAFGVTRPAEAWQSVPGPRDGSAWDTLRFLMGLLIVVQGFETSRFMGDLYDAQTQISAMRHAQLLATVIYVAFFALMMPLYGEFDEPTDVAGFIDVIAIVSLWLPLMMVFAAVASEFSASVADSIGASELVADITGYRIGTQSAYWLIGITALAVLWLTDVVGLVALASRAFGAFYALQCGVAALVAGRSGAPGRAIWFASLSAVCAAIALFGIPAEG